jgi:hypothetical protein
VEVEHQPRAFSGHYSKVNCGVRSDDRFLCMATYFNPTPPTRSRSISSEREALSLHCDRLPFTRTSQLSDIGETGFEPATARPPAECATRLRHSPWSLCILTNWRLDGYAPGLRGGSSTVEPQPSKLMTRVRFSSAASEVARNRVRERDSLCRRRSCEHMFPLPDRGRADAPLRCV